MAITEDNTAEIFNTLIKCGAESGDIENALLHLVSKSRWIVTEILNGKNFDKKYLENYLEQIEYNLSAYKKYKGEKK